MRQACILSCTKADRMSITSRFSIEISVKKSQRQCLYLAVEEDAQWNNSTQFTMISFQAISILNAAYRNQNHGSHMKINKLS